MAKFQKHDLLYSYRWTARPSDDPRITGKPDSTLINRGEGYEVLYMINALMTEWSQSLVATGQKIERMIQEHPAGMHSRAKVKQWIHENWKRY